MTAITSSPRSAGPRVAGLRFAGPRFATLVLAGAFAAAAGPASAAVCGAFTLTDAQVAVFENGTWTHTAFQQNGAGQFMVAADPGWPQTVSLILRWDINPGVDPAILPAASLAPLPVYLDYQYVANGFGTSFGAVAQVDDVTMNTGSRPVYFEMAIAMPQIGCDLIRSTPATLSVTPWLEIDPDRIPELACQGPGCDLWIQRPGDAVINPGRIQQVQPRIELQEVLPQQQGATQGVTPQQLLPQLQLRN